MTCVPMLTENELRMMTAVFEHHPEVERVILFGSRAMGTARAQSDIDLAVYGTTDRLTIASIAEELDELPLPYQFDVQSGDAIQHPPLREHIERVGLTLYERESSSV